MIFLSRVMFVNDNHVTTVLLLTVYSERLSKIEDIKKNVKDAILVCIFFIKH